ncbi:hypothetical protein QQS21_000459 [Conoideocrella luteorostrata]|uniref:Protein kinase domain-containing protein n=1 Tax=Conoideocrella luteorostrata TaxID=1105319 RepID=A0AAJ0CYW9_9HYPO|nr:hypothetical protein QQS21_000459 [Conoideocrella luteorostrata]
MPAHHYVEHVEHGCGNEVTFHVRWNDARMIVKLDYNPSPDATENALIKSYTSAGFSSDEDEVDANQKEILDAIVRVGASLFDELAPPLVAPPSDLHSKLYPPSYSFELVTVRDTLQLILQGSHHFEMPRDQKMSNERAVPPPGLQSPEPEIRTSSFQLEVEKIPQVQRYLTTDIIVVEDLLGDGYISHVLVHGRDMCAKVGGDFDGGALQRELDCLQKITANAAQQMVRVNVPKLLGIIETPHDRRAIGILEEFIPHPKSVQLSTLAMAENIRIISPKRKEAWATQIRQTVKWLHDIGIIWGDGKADNVLIHPDTDEAWLIDFGGGTTDGWVDEDLADTSDGDDQAVERIYEFLELREATQQSRLITYCTRPVIDVQEYIDAFGEDWLKYAGKNI